MVQPDWAEASTEASVVEQRGDMTLVQFTGPQPEALCIWTPQGVSLSASGNVVNREPLGERLFADFGWKVGMVDVNTRNGMRILTGRVSPKVGKVVISTEDGLEVTATIGTGRVLAWWPSMGDVKHVRLYDEAGSLLQTSPIPVR